MSGDVTNQNPLLLLAPISKFVDFSIFSFFPQHKSSDTKMDNSGKDKEATALVAEAEKKMKSSQSFFGAMFG